MTTVRRTIAALFALALLFSSATADAASPATKRVIRQSRMVSWSLSPGPGGCYQLSSTVSGSSMFNEVITVWTYPDGSKRVTDIATSKGRATDTQGRSYQYNYTNRATFAVPPSGTPVQVVSMVDSFELKGKTHANRIKAVFDWSWSYIPADPTAIPDDFNIGFPPSTDWVQRKTIGDPIHCDPI